MKHKQFSKERWEQYVDAGLVVWCWWNEGSDSEGKDHLKMMGGESMNRFSRSIASTYNSSGHVATVVLYSKRTSRPVHLLT